MIFAGDISAESARCLRRSEAKGVPSVRLSVRPLGTRTSCVRGPPRGFPGDRRQSFAYSDSGGLMVRGGSCSTFELFPGGRKSVVSVVSGVSGTGHSAKKWGALIELSTSRLNAPRPGPTSPRLQGPDPRIGASKPAPTHAASGTLQAGACTAQRPGSLLPRL